jgi:hypothetical protein
MGLIGLPPKECQHHWHAHAANGKEGEILTCAPPYYPVHCCHCNANAHAITTSNQCGKYDTTIGVNAIKVIRIRQEASV